MDCATQHIEHDTGFGAYQTARISHWDTLAQRNKPKSFFSAFYHTYLQKLYRFLIPQASRVLEIGCGKGDLLASLQPSLGVGIDFAPTVIERARQQYSHLYYPHLHFYQMDAHLLDEARMQDTAIAREPFDIIILSDIINDAWDVQALFKNLLPLCHESTRIVINFHSHLWEQPFLLAQRLGWIIPHPPQNWLTPDDVSNMLSLAGFETVRSFPDLLFPMPIPLISTFFNRYLAKIFPFTIFDIIHVMVARPRESVKPSLSVSVVIPARNEAGNIEAALQRTPDMGSKTEIIFVEGNSTDNTWATIQEMALKYSHRHILTLQQPGKGKGDAVRTGFAAATGHVLMILDADLTVSPESLPRFYEAIASGKVEFVNGVRLVYPQEKEAMRFFNLVGNKFFSLAFSWLLGRSIKDTLCGTKVLHRKHYEQIAKNRQYFGDFDPFGDFDLLFGAAKLNLKICDLPIRYRERVYGETNIKRWEAGWLLLKMVCFAARRMKFV